MNTDYIYKCAEDLTKAALLTYITGPSGAGKTTLAEQLSKETGADHLNLDLLAVPQTMFDLIEKDQPIKGVTWPYEEFLKDVRPDLLERGVAGREKKGFKGNLRDSFAKYCGKQSFNTPLEIIDKLQSYGDLGKAFTEGFCYDLALMLYLNTPNSEIAYIPNYFGDAGHYTLKKDDHFYDITGDITDNIGDREIEIDNTRDDLLERLGI